jgi:hypothetical protein
MEALSEHDPEMSTEAEEVSLSSVEDLTSGDTIDENGDISAPENNPATMQGTTSKDLYRSGRGSDPALDNVRPGKEFTAGDDGSEILRPGQNPPNGLSTFESINGAGKWWKLPAGSSIPDGLRLVNDEPGHWAWEPTSPMLRSDYIDLVMQTLGLWEGPIRVK